MKLKYSILWFEDDRSKFESFRHDILAAKIQSWGFEFNGSVFVDNPQKFMEYTFEDFDLIVVDYNLEDDSRYGSDFINDIRVQNSRIDVIFYSARGLDFLWEKVHAERLEGVFLSDVQNIIDKIVRVADHSIKQIVALDNMRGIVMAQVGDLDAEMRKFIQMGLKKLSTSDPNTKPEKFYDEFYVYFFSKQMEQNEGLRENMRVFENRPTEKGMLDLCDSNRLWTLTGHLIKELKRHSNINLSAFDISKYGEEILKERNVLAHGNSEFKYSEPEAKKLRNRLIEYRKLYAGMINAIK